MAILDMQDRNGENYSRLFACEQMAIASGVPFIVTDDVTEAVQYGLVLFASDVYHSSFNAAERNMIINYVSNGGVLLSSNIRTSHFHPLFGISGFHTSRQNYRINWDITKDDTLFEYFDDPMEKETSLGRLTYDEVIYSRHYDLDGAEPLAYFDNDPDKPAFVRNKFGNGFAYTFGLSFRDVILLPQLGHDYQAQRVWSNGFEPSGDVFVLLLRSLYTKHVPHAVWKHTSIANSYNTVMITHDLDSRTAMDTMLGFAISEKERGFKANYNATVRYFNDDAMSDYYLGSEYTLDMIKEMGHVISSHSVGHFRDFAEFDLGPAGLTMDTYQPYYDGNSTSGGYVMPEVEISKRTLEENHGVDVLTFRSGHLAFPDKLVNALEAMGYKYDSSTSSNNVLYSFPFQLLKDRSFSGEVSDVLEVSMTISDVFPDEEFNAHNYHEVVNNHWMYATTRYADNYSPVTLLVHPNRNWKLDAQNAYLDALNVKNYLTTTDNYGDFWKKREALEFYTNLKGKDTVVITVMNNSLPFDPRLSFGVFGSETLDKIIIQDENGNRFTEMNQEGVNLRNHVLVADMREVVSVPEHSRSINPSEITAYPNPVKPGKILNLKGDMNADRYIITDISGKVAARGSVKNSTESALQIPQYIKSGYYIIQLIEGNNVVHRVKIAVSE